MNNFAIDKKLIKQLVTIRDKKKPSEDILNSLYAQAMIEFSIYQYKKERLLSFIDKCLEEKNKDRFLFLSDKYKQLLHEYKKGKVLCEKGYELKLTFEE